MRPTSRGYFDVSVSKCEYLKFSTDLEMDRWRLNPGQRIHARQETRESKSGRQVYRFRDGEVDPHVCRYEYKLKRVDGGLEISYRRAVLDLESLESHGAVSIIL